MKIKNEKIGNEGPATKQPALDERNVAYSILQVFGCTCLFIPKVPERNISLFFIDSLFKIKIFYYFTTRIN